MAIDVTGAPAGEAALQGKSEPEASKGEELGFPYGGGDAMIMWALLVEANSAMAEAERMVLIDMLM